MYVTNLKLIKSLIERKHFQEKQYKIEEFEINETKFISTIFLIKKGCLAINKINDRGEVLFLKLLKEHQSYGGQFCPKGKKYCSYLKTLVDKTIVYEFSMDVIFKMINEDYNYQKDLFQLWSEQYSIIEQRNKLLKIKSISLRFIVFLCTLNKLVGKDYNEKGDRIIEKILSQEEISRYICTNRASISYVVSHLKEKSLIDCNGQRIILKKEFFNCYNNVLKIKKIKL